MVNKTLVGLTALIGIPIVAGVISFYNHVGTSNYLKLPRFHSTTPVITNPDGSIDAYRPLKKGQKLEDAIKKGPVEKYVPPVEKSAPPVEKYNPKNYDPRTNPMDNCDCMVAKY